MLDASRISVVSIVVAAGSEEYLCHRYPIWEIAQTESVKMMNITYDSDQNAVEKSVPIW